MHTEGEEFEPPRVHLVMLLVKTKLSRSKIDGIGVFAAQFISKGTVVQKFISGIDIEIESEKLYSLPVIEKEYILHYTYRHKITNKYVLCSDDARFLNHSETPNLISDSLNEEIDVAARDIQEGEELTVNYKDFDADWNYKLLGTNKDRQ